MRSNGNGKRLVAHLTFVSFYCAIACYSCCFFFEFAHLSFYVWGQYMCTLTCQAVTVLCQKGWKMYWYRLPQHNRNMFHILCFKAKGMLGETCDFFFLSPTTCCASPLHYIFFSKCQRSWGTPNTLSDSNFGFSHNQPKTHNRQMHAFSDLLKIRSASVHSVDPSLGFAVKLARVITLVTLSMPSISWLFAIRVCLKYRLQKYRSVKMCI